MSDKQRLWIGRFLTGFSALFLAFDGTIHMLNIAPVVEANAKLGWPDVMPMIGGVELACLALYLFPRTSVLGAVLLTGHLGGAIATQVRVGAPLFSTALFPVYVGLMLWGGLYLRNERLRSLFPIAKG